MQAGDESGLLGASRCLYGYQNTARRIETRLKKRHCDTLVSSFVIRPTRPTYAALSRGAEVMVTVLTVHAAANVITIRVDTRCATNMPFPD
ncbi:hypothetical protein TNCV_5128541 [Trichonephila clavipes]|nr:hypothetical protein TNCV_5128541 [Trichonephila clavipes]